MLIYPMYLGLKRHITIVSARAVPAFLRTDNPAFRGELSPGTRLGPLGRWLTRGAKAEPEAAAAVYSTMAGSILFGLSLCFSMLFAIVLGVVIGTAGNLISCVIASAVGLALMGGIMKFQRRECCNLHNKPVTLAEVEALLSASKQDLERDYLTLVLDAIRQPVSPEAEKEVRAALRALSEAIDRLPLYPGQAMDTSTLRQEAAAVLAKAQSEPDTVIAASLERRAEALQRRADVNERSALLTRRAAALREELAAQAEALRAGLSTFDTGGTDIAGLADLAQAVRGVAAEAAAVADAREELDVALSGRAETQDAPLRVRLGSG